MVWRACNETEVTVTRFTTVDEMGFVAATTFLDLFGSINTEFLRFTNERCRRGRGQTGRKQSSRSNNIRFTCQDHDV
jgi:hypothetical protein